VYDLEPERVGTFDLVHAGDILLHLERPLEALRCMHGVLAPAGVAMIADVVDPELPASPDGHHLVRYHGGWNTVHWWTPSIDALAQMMVDAGFSDVSLRLVYKLALREGAGPWRALLRATR
jgi:SAM-dependent methyltransferase